MQGNGNHVCLLGTKGGPAIRPGSTNPTSNLLRLSGRQIVVDCGLGVTRGLVDQGMQLKDLSLIFITHLHSDHYLELGPLIHTAWTAGLKTPVTIYGPEGLARYWQQFVESMRDDIELRIADEGRPDLFSLVIIKVLEEGEVLKDDALQVNAMRNTHPPLVDTFALSFAGDDVRVVFSGDTAYLPALANFSIDANLLIHEAMLEEALPALFARIGNSDDRLRQHWMRSHTFAHDAGRIATAAGVAALALNHLIPSDDPEYDDSHWQAALAPTWKGLLYVGKDGMRINLVSH
ncbi:MAG: ribonuclease BN (tRNA processing enzyme) [Granulosicoccus sp.]|jgi:ribonuclease BN (tRNA processing enzyme)